MRKPGVYRNFRPPGELPITDLKTYFQNRRENNMYVKEKEKLPVENQALVTHVRPHIHPSQ